MGIVTVKSTAITNRDSVPAKLSNPALQNAMVRELVGVCAAGASDSSTSKYIFGSIPSNARISAVILSTSAAAGGSCAADIGLYDTTANGSAAVDDDFFGAAIDLHTAALTNANETFQGAESETVANGEKMIWEILGLSTDPSKNYDVVMALTADNSSNAFSALLKVTYVV